MPHRRDDAESGAIARGAGNESGEKRRLKDEHRRARVGCMMWYVRARGGLLVVVMTFFSLYTYFELGAAPSTVPFCTTKRALE